MKLLAADDPNVRYHALLAVQKLMVHNWEYLGKQLDADTGAAATTWKSRKEAWGGRGEVGCSIMFINCVQKLAEP